MPGMSNVQRFKTFHVELWSLNSLTHHLNLNLSKNLIISTFDSVVQQPGGDVLGHAELDVLSAGLRGLEVTPGLRCPGGSHPGPQPRPRQSHRQQLRWADHPDPWPYSDRHLPRSPLRSALYDGHEDRGDVVRLRDPQVWPRPGWWHWPRLSAVPRVPAPQLRPLRHALHPRPHPPCQPSRYWLDPQQTDGGAPWPGRGAKLSGLQHGRELLQHHVQVKHLRLLLLLHI